MLMAFISLLFLYVSKEKYPVGSLTAFMSSILTFLFFSCILNRKQKKEGYYEHCIILFCYTDKSNCKLHFSVHRKQKKTLKKAGESRSPAFFSVNWNKITLHHSNISYSIFLLLSNQPYLSSFSC